MRTICLDFDGVVHAYTSGWKGNTVIADGPVPGVKEAIEELRKTFMVKVFSSRCKTPEGKAAIEEWLKKHDISVSAVVDHKPAAFIFVDDRGYQFNGDWTKSVEEIKNYRSYLEDQK